MRMLCISTVLELVYASVQLGRRMMRMMHEKGPSYIHPITQHKLYRHSIAKHT
jgi:hypothetical protein